MIELTRAEARRVAVRAQLLGADRPGDLLEVVRHLFAVDVDAVRAVAPSQELVMWSRLGPAYAQGDLADALDTPALVELRGQVRAAEDIALYREEMARWPGTGALQPWQEHSAEWVEANDACRRDLLSRIADAGPTPARDLPDSCAVPWRSSGWSNAKNVVRLLDFMEARGEIAVAGHVKGRDRLWDLAERVYPDEPPVPLQEARAERGARRLRALGVARRGGPANPGEAMDLGEAGEACTVEGLRGRWRVDPAYLDQPLEPRVALLSPLDRLVFDRERMTDLFGFDYQLEMYKPAAKRRWGYYALPVLVGDRLIGKLDATADPKAGLLRVTALHEDEPFGDDVRGEVDAEIEALAAFLGLDRDDEPAR
ncbi:winged helix-turn-helix domain-containing protein [Nocardioides mangrovicus]|uniref:Winged helix-turn-helix domain-containing protein n=1 Tax=Nocardioides mangrovicus TaxID=2478913 RepID=A0A3L8P8E8_9ACTN|nr:crosslink repair DNA glycosylase YcaQ family protein [Nocardioides mangrovicus]RLV50748.1 winged helix-turn-helix domain-containing protein [Nocardioides mangrovicus]